MIRTRGTIPIRAVRPLAVLLLAFALAGCGGPSSPGGGFAPPDPTPPTDDPLGFAGNTNAILDGVVYGEGSAESDALRRVLPTTVRGEASGFVAGDAVLGRNDPAGDVIDYVVPIRNDGVARCFVEVHGLALLDAGGAELHGEADAYATGSVAALGADTYTGTCLDAGESGYLMGVTDEARPGLFEDAAELVIETIDADAGDIMDPGLAISLPSYQLSSDEEGASLLVDVRSAGGTAVTLGEMSTYVRLDADGSPHGWSFLLEPPRSELAAGEFAVYRDEDVDFAGSAAGMHAFIDVEPVAVDTSVSAERRAGAAGLSRRERWLLRDARERALRAELERRADAAR